jgi:gamma-glutamyltranspeptidase/glutathione hydrolase
MRKVRSSSASVLHPRCDVPGRQSSVRGVWLRFGSTFAAFLWLAGCGGGGQEAASLEPLVEAQRSFFGGVVADEPRAAQIGQEMLEAGGSAADAATAMFFALTVTYPVAASIAGGGACVAYDPRQKRADALLFLNPAAKAAIGATGGPVGVPMAARGMAILQARYGQARWERTIAPAEQLARFGFTVSRAYGNVLSRAANDLSRVPALSPVFQANNGRFYVEGQKADNRALADSLARLRTAGIVDFTSGALARRMVEDVGRFGGVLTVADLQAGVPQWTAPRDVGTGRIGVLVPPLPGSDLFAAAWPAVAETASPSNFLGIRGSSSRARSVDALLGIDTRATPPRFDIPGATGFSAMDRFGQAVSCTVTNGQPFGVRAVGQETGILFAPPTKPDDEAASMLPLVAANMSVNQSFVAASATDGSYAPAVLADVVAAALLGGRPAAVAIAAPRIVRSGTAAVHEPKFDGAIIATLESKNLRDVEVPRLSQIGLMYCDGLPRGPGSCRFVADPRSFGVALGDNGAPLADRERRCFNTRTAEVCD